MNIEFTLNNLKITTFSRGDKGVYPLSDIDFTNQFDEILSVKSSDEILIIYYQENLGKGFIKLSKEESLNYSLTEKISKIIKQNNIDPTKCYLYFAPSLTFSHNPTDRETLLKILNDGFKLAVKRTSGVDYLDFQMLNFSILHKMGFKIENTHFSDIDTFENKNLLYSKARGDIEENLTIF